MSFALTVGGVTFLMAVIWGSPLIELMRRFRLGKVIRLEGPQSHMSKMGTPGMGGILIVGWTVVVSIVVNIVQLVQALEIAESVILLLGVMVAYAIMGGIDDYQGIRLQPGEGMRARTKFIIQLCIAIVTAFILYWFVNDGHGWVAVPTVPVLLDIGIFYIPVAVFIISATSNAINLTDGLDGLAGIIAATAFAAYGIIAFLQSPSNEGTFSGPNFITVFCFIVVGSCFAFLWFNAHPAQTFMGDVGSQSLGAALGVVALMTNQWLILPIVAFIPFITTVSTMLQVSSAVLSRKYLGRDIRPFKMSPLHNHFVLLGWSETQIVQRWWLIGLIAAMIGIALALL